MKNIIKLSLCMIAMLVSIYLIYYHYKDNPVVNYDDYISRNDDNFEMISNLRTKYNNNEIIMYIELPDVFSIPIVQTENNTYYLEHNIYKESSVDGSPFLDFRNKSLHDRKLIIYGDNKMDKTLPLSNFVSYQDKNFYSNHPSITVYTDHSKKTYTIFSVFIPEDESYLEINGFPGSEFEEHLKSLKERSMYDTGVFVEDNAKIIVFRICTKESGCNTNTDYQVVVAKENKPNKDK